MCPGGDGIWKDLGKQRGDLSQKVSFHVCIFWSHLWGTLASDLSAVQLWLSICNGLEVSSSSTKWYNSLGTVFPKHCYFLSLEAVLAYAKDHWLATVKMYGQRLSFTAKLSVYHFYSSTVNCFRNGNCLTMTILNHL